MGLKLLIADNGDDGDDGEIGEFCGELFICINSSAKDGILSVCGFVDITRFGGID